eukprot:TRINITY_DN12886_c0_g1_i3.p1 TRINITY_DN12886_c0_g1~~TRINITY_DN12886_c0_g1_i3.p1  ORF type:complete len:240 (-),score=59.10 TRINITY_DN12886_c0_g1_i3:241-960(-)
MCIRDRPMHRPALHATLAALAPLLIGSGVVSWLEERSMVQGMYMVLDALLNNGSGKYRESSAYTRLVLAFISLYGFFMLVDQVVWALTSFTLGVPDSESLDDSNSSAQSRQDLNLMAIREARLLRVGALWSGTMASMFLAFVWDHSRDLDWEDGGSPSPSSHTLTIIHHPRGHAGWLGWTDTLDLVSSAVLYATTTGCSGGLGYLSNDVVGACYMVVSVPVTAWFATELAMYRKMGKSR